MEVPSSEPGAAPRGRRLRRTLVAVSFVWLVAIAGFFAWAAWSGSVVEGEAPRLVANVDAAVGSALDEDPGLRERLLEVSSMASFGGPDVLSVVPRVEGAEAFLFGAGEGGSAVIGYRGTSLAGGVCVRAVLSVEGRVQVERGDCGLD